MTYRNFIDLDGIETSELRSILDRAKSLKNGDHGPLLSGKQLAMIFEKASTRTRVSFEVGMNQLGGNALMMASQDSQLGRGEPISDTAGVLSRYVDIIMIRTFQHETLLELAEKSTIPVINGLTDYSHPCQVMADILTLEEKFGDIKGKKIAWIGDYNNVLTSWVHAANHFECELVIACPEEFSPSSIDSKFVTITSDPEQAASGAHCLMTDTWVSMGDQDAEYKKDILAPFQINDEMMRLAADDAVFMHCLPAHREEEVTSSVIDGPQSIIFDEAENRLHAQKAIMLWCLGQ